MVDSVLPTEGVRSEPRHEELGFPSGGNLSCHWGWQEWREVGMMDGKVCVSQKVM